jgi:hypothetical protein
MHEARARSFFEDRFAKGTQISLKKSENQGPNTQKTTASRYFWGAAANGLSQAGRAANRPAGTRAGLLNILQVNSAKIW